MSSQTLVSRTAHSALRPGSDVSIGDVAIRTLRLGQRVKFDLAEEEGRTVARDLRLVTFE